MANRMMLSIVADANPTLQALNQVQKNLDRFMASAESAGQAIGGSLGKAIDNFSNFAKGGAAAAGVLAGGFAAASAAAFALTASAADQIDQLDRLSQKTGIALGTLQAWSVIMAENGIQAESLTSSMRTLSKQIVEARDPTSKAAAAFKEIGVTITGLSTTESVIRDLSDVFKDLPDGPEKARIAVDLLGKAGLDMIPMLNQGSKAFDESKEAAKRFGAQLSDLQNNSLKEADTGIDHLGVALNALKLNLASVFAPAVEWAARMLADAFGVLARWSRDLDTALDTLAIRITHLGLAAKELGNVLFSKDALNTDAWKQALENIKLIDKEASKLIAKRRELANITAEQPGTQVSMSANVSAKAAVKSAPKLPPEWHAQQNDHITEYLANRRAEEALGHVLVQIAQREFRELQQKVKVQDEIVQGVADISDQEELGHQIMIRSREAWEHRNDALEMAVEHAKVLDEAQQAMFATERGLFGASDEARRVRMNLIEAEGALQRQKINETVMLEEDKAAKLLLLEIQLDTKRRQTIQQYPSFFEQQMQAIVQSNSFSIGQITTTWTSGLANAAVNGGNFVQQAWKSTQVAVLQGLLNFGIQKAAQLAMQASVEMGIVSATAAATVGINTAKNATIVAGDAAAAGATVSIWGSAGAAIAGTFGVITGAISTFFTGTIIPMFATLGEALMTFLSAIATSLDISIFGAPFSVPVWAAVGLIAAAVGVISAFAFADGGIVTGPTMGLVGEAGSSEAVIPLNKRGAAFMREAVGGGNGGGSTTVVVELDGRVLARSVFDSMPSIMRVRGISA